MLYVLCLILISIVCRARYTNQHHITIINRQIPEFTNSCWVWRQNSYTHFRIKQDLHASLRIISSNPRVIINLSFYLCARSQKAVGRRILCWIHGIWSWFVCEHDFNNVVNINLGLLPIRMHLIDEMLSSVYLRIKCQLIFCLITLHCTVENKSVKCKL